MSFLKPLHLPFKALNATGDVLRCGLINFPPLNRQEQSGAELIIKGPFSAVVETVRDFLGYQLNVVLAAEPFMGFRLKNGTFTGVMGEFQRGGIDLLFGPMSVNEERAELGEPIAIDVSDYRLITWYPSKVVDPFSYASAFTLEVWFHILVSLLTLGFVSWVLESLTPWNGNPKSSLLQFVWEFFASLFPQDGSSRHDVWLRVLFSTHLLTFSVVLMCYLNCQLTSAMTIKKYEKFINAFEDVLQFPRVRIFAEDGSSLAQMFVKPKSDRFRKLGPKLISVRGLSQPGPMLIEKISEVVARKRVIAAASDTCKGFLEYALKHFGKCPQVMITTESAGVMILSMFASRSLPSLLREKIKLAALVAREAFLFQKIADAHSSRGRTCGIRNEVGESKRLEFRDFQGSFLLALIGISIAGVAFLAETSLKACRKIFRTLSRNLNSSLKDTRRPSDFDNVPISLESSATPEIFDCDRGARVEFMSVDTNDPELPVPKQELEVHSVEHRFMFLGDRKI